MSTEACPDCGGELTHDPECHVLWAETLNETPTNVKEHWRPNPFLAMLKEPTHETEQVDPS